MLSFISGESPHPQGWSDEGATAVGVLLREFHRAAATFVPPADATWMPWYARDLVGKAPLIGHCDTAAWNILARDGRPVALVDWDTAGPFDARWELAQTVWLNAQLHDDDVAARVGLPDAAARARQARLILDGYGFASKDRIGFVQAMVEFAIRSAAQEAIDAGVTRTGTNPVAAGGIGGGPPLVGQQLLWSLTWRTRSAAWMLRQRRLIERALS